MASLTQIKQRRHKNNLDIEREVDLDTNLPEVPAFPLLLMSAAVMKTFLDIASFGFVGWLFGIVFILILWLWVMNKSGIMRRILMKRVLIRGGIAVIISIIPIINFFPEAMIVVGLTYLHEKKEVQKLRDRAKSSIAAIKRSL